MKSAKIIVILFLFLLTACELSTDKNEKAIEKKPITIEELEHIGISVPEFPEDTIVPTHGSKVTKPPAGSGGGD